MGINRDRPDLWKADINASVDFYNRWFMEFAPRAFREARSETSKQVERALDHIGHFQDITPDTLRTHPEVLPILRMATCPPIADTIMKLVDVDILTWLPRKARPNDDEIDRAATVIADRLCGSIADPVIRNAQERRQLASIAAFLDERGYHEAEAGTAYDQMSKGTYSFRTNIPVFIAAGSDERANIPVDVVIVPKSSDSGFPILIEAKSAGDFSDTNKRRKEEAVKMQQLRYTYGDVSFSLFLCGYFDTGYLGYEAAEGIDWIWEHRIEDLGQLGI